MTDSTRSQRDFAYWVDLLVRRRLIALQTACVVFGLAVIATFLWTPTYQSTAKILVQDKRANYLVSPDLQDDAQAKQAIMARPVTQEDLNSEVELLTSIFLIKQAIDGLRPPHAERSTGTDLMGAAKLILALPEVGYASLHNAPIMTQRDRWALKLERNLHPSVIKLSDIIEVSFTAHDPAWARDFLSRLLEHYLAYHAGLSADPQAEQFFRQQAQLLQAKLDASEDLLRQFEVQNGITDLQAQKQALVTRVSDLQIQDNRVGARLAGARQQEVALTEELKTTPERIGKEMRAVQNQALAQIKPQVMQLQAERAELLSRYQPNSQRIQEIDAKLAAAQRILASEDHLEVQEKSSDLNPLWVSMSTHLEQTKTNVAADAATQAALQKEIDDLRSEITRMTNNGVALERLQRQVAADKEAYQSYVRKSEEARTAQALNLSKILNVSVAQPPSFPLQPVFPKVWLNLMAGLVLAVGLGVGAAYWEEQQDDRIYSTAAIYEATGLKTVAMFREEA